MVLYSSIAATVNRPHVTFGRSLNAGTSGQSPSATPVAFDYEQRPQTIGIHSNCASRHADLNLVLDTFTSTSDDGRRANCLPNPRDNTRICSKRPRG